MKIAWINRFDDAITEAGSKVPTLPASNIKNPHLATKWHSASGDNNTYILAALTAQFTIRCVAVLGTNLTSSATIRVRGSNADNTAVSGEIIDTGTLSNVIDTNYGNFYRDLGADYTARYWRIDFNDATINNIQVGRIFIGPAWSPSKEMLFGWGMNYNDSSRRTRAQGGQLYIDKSFRFRTLDFTLAFMDKAEMYDNAFEIARRNGMTEDVLVIPEENGTYNSEISIFGLVANAFPLTHQTFQVYRQRYRIEERL